MQEIQTFDFSDQPVRITERNNQPYFLVADLCRVLDLGNVTEATRALDDDELDSVILNSGGQRRKNLCVSESGLYALIFKSRKPNAKAFRKWMTSEVLPAIRRTGGYGVAASGYGIARIQSIIEETIIAVHEGRCPIPKATVISILSAQYLRSQALMHPLPQLPTLPAETQTPSLL